MSKLIQIRDVPESVHRTLKSRAALSGRSLSEYLRNELARIAGQPTMDEVLDRIAKLDPVEMGESSADAVRAFRDELERG
ncbi:MAG: hypothetical protein QOG26_1435 [Solirubrobacterales bacterium]|jgi:plasmid stability protein|nr:hypothetical protein [Solirubrobacterales bacterium]